MPPVMTVNQSAILSALDVLCEVSEHDLNPYRDEVRATLDRLERYIRSSPTTVRDHGPASAPSSTTAELVTPYDSLKFCFTSGASLKPAPPLVQVSRPVQTHSFTPLAPHPSHPEARSSLASSHRPNPSRHQGTDELVKHLDKFFQGIKEFIERTAPETTPLERPFEGADARVQDIISIDGTLNPTMLAQLRRGLSQRALAREYDLWHKKRTGKSTVDERASTLKKPGANGLFTQFMNENQGRFGDGRYQKSLAGAFRRGIKLLVYDQLFRTTGISAVLIFCFRASKNSRPVDFGELNCALPDDIKAFAEQNARWIDRWQLKYDKWCERVNDPLSLDVDKDFQGNCNRKRPSASDSTSRRKRLRSKSVERTLQGSLQVTQEQAAISPVGNGAGASDTTPEHGNPTQPMPEAHSPAHNQTGESQEDGASMPGITHSTRPWDEEIMTDTSSVAMQNSYQNISMAGPLPVNNDSMDNTAGQQFNLLERMSYTQQEPPNQNTQRIVETSPYPADVLMWSETASQQQQAIETCPYPADVLMWPGTASQQKQAIETCPYPADHDLFPYRAGNTLGDMCG
ncbi:MAG: hypothetical protein Q9210_004688 [Variospora velana]